MGIGGLRRGTAAEWLRHHSASGAAPEEIFGPPVRADHGDGFNPFRLPDRQSWSYGGCGNQPRHRHRVLVRRAGLRAVRKSEPTTRANRRMVAGCDFLPRRVVFSGAPEDVAPTKWGSGGRAAAGLSAGRPQVSEEEPAPLLLQ